MSVPFVENSSSRGKGNTMNLRQLAPEGKTAPLLESSMLPQIPFSDGGKYNTVEKALGQARKMVAQELIC